MRTPAPLAPEDPTHAGRFRLLGRLAQGGMGLVYLARRDDSPDSLVALKMIRPELAHDPDLRERFAHEVAAARRLGVRTGAETHVARTVAADPTATRPWLATEFVPGPSLAEEVGARPQTPVRVLEVAHSLAAALAAMHEQGLLHGDIKPSNVVLGPDGLRLVDLGLAREHTDDDRAGSRFGSPGWSPPELGRHAQADPSVDVHGWGMTVAFAATGRPPFGSGTAAEVRERMRTTTPDLQGMPDPLLPVVAAALDPDPARRPSAPELLAQVEAARACVASGASELGSATVPDHGNTGAWAGPTLLDAFAEDEEVPRRSPVLPVLGVAAAVLGLVVLCAVAFAAFGGGGAPAAGQPTTASGAGASSPSASTAAAAPTRRATASVPAAASSASPVQAAAKPAPDKAKGKKGGTPHGPGKPKKH